MRFTFEMPRIHRFRPSNPSDAENSKGSPLVKWGWCSAKDFIELINRFYQFDWKPYELLLRFGLYAKSTKKLGTQKLMIVYSRGKKFVCEEYKESSLQYLTLKEEDFLVPAGFAKKLIEAL